MMELRDYQVALVDAARAQYAAGKRRVVAVAPTGAGKTVFASHVVYQAVAKGSRVVFLAHRAELIGQASKKLASCGVLHGTIQAGTTYDGRRVQVASIPTLARRSTIPPADLVVIDECFIAGTLVSGIPIEKLKIGDMVECFDHKNNTIKRRPVTALFAHDCENLYEIKFSNGKSITCTGNHPIWVNSDKQYKRAEKIACGDTVLCIIERHDEHIHKMRPLWLNNKRTNKASKGQGKKKSKCVLLQKSHARIHKKKKVGNNGKNKQKTRIKTDDFKKPNDGSVYTRKNASINAYSKHFEKPQKREWPRASYTTTNASYSIGVGHRGANKNTPANREWIPALLQNRYSKHYIKNRYRGRRWKPLFIETEISRCKKDKIFGEFRVEDIKVQKRSSSSFGYGMCGKSKVYNIEVFEFNNYFANGVLVHNCHHTNAASWASLITRYPEARVLGLTATPYRTDGRGLGEHYDALVHTVTISDLIQRGFLVRPITYAPAAPDMAGVRKVGGDFATGAMAEKVDRPALIGDIVDHWKRLGQDRITVGFCASVAHAEHVAQAFRAAGIPAAAIDGAMDARLREDRLSDLAAGRLRVLTNVGILTEGWDLPACGCIIQARPTASLSLYHQIVGRGLRSCPGKSDCIVLDHAGNTLRHGFVTDPVDYSLDGLAKRPQGPSIRTCPQCMAAFPAGTPSCSLCGYVWPPPEPEPLPTVGSGMLQELRPGALDRPSEKNDALQKLIAKGKEEGYAKTWAFIKFHSMYGHWPNVAGRTHARS